MARPAYHRGIPAASGAVVLAVVATSAIAAPWLSPQAPARQHPNHLNAPPARVRVIGADGRLHRPFVHPLRLEDRLASRYAEDRSRRVPLVFMSGGRLVRTAAEDEPLFLLGADRLGRDVFARLVHGARVSLGVAGLGALGALLLGAVVGGLAGYARGWVDDGLMQVADFVLILPTIYVVLALRAIMPLVVDPATLFLVMSLILAVVGWPFAARGVRAIVASEAHREYAVAARSLGAGHVRLLLRHLLPASRGFLAVQTTLLVPAFVLAEATLSYVGLGFTEPTPSWGTMLQDAARNVRDLASYPWLLAPIAAIFGVVLAVHLVAGGQDETGYLQSVQTTLQK